MLNSKQQTLLDKLFTAIDAKDAGRFGGFLATDGSFRFGSATAVTGRIAIVQAVEAFFATIAALSHNVISAFADGDTLVCEGVVTYQRHDGTEISLPFVDVFQLDGSLIKNYKIYMDIGPLYAP